MQSTHSSLYSIHHSRSRLKHGSSEQMLSGNASLEVQYMADHTCSAGQVQYVWDVWVDDGVIPYWHEKLYFFLVQHKLLVQHNLVMLAQTVPEGCPDNYISSHLQLDGNFHMNHVSVPISWATQTFTRSVLRRNFAQKFCILHAMKSNIGNQCSCC